MKKFLVSTRKSTLTVMGVCMLFLLSCREEIPESVPLGSTKADPTLEHILSLGFKAENVVDKGEFYLAEGDIRFWKRARLSKNARPNQQGIKNYDRVSYTSANNISVRVLNNFPNSTFYQKVVTATQEAASRWNAANSKLQVTYVTGAFASITIGYEPNMFPNDQYGVGDYPQDCLVGPKIGITEWAVGLNQSQMDYNITHEMGHTFGLAHTDVTGPGVYQIYGTPPYDDVSVMQSGVAEGLTSNPASVPSRQFLSPGDNNAIRFLFPASGPTISVSYVPGGNPTLPIRVNWTPTRFCDKTVVVDIYDGEVKVKSSSTTDNDGWHDFATQQLISGHGYEFRVHPGTDETDFMYIDATINF